MEKPEKGGLPPSGETRDKDTETTGRNLDSERQERRRRFAKSLTKSVFGRFYWDERQEAELRRTMNGAKRRKT